MGNYKFYAVLGRNGVAVADSWASACAMRKYLRNTSATGFDDFHDAEDFALQAFADRFPNSINATLSVCQPPCFCQAL